MIAEDAYKYNVRGKWHARLPAPVRLTFATWSPVVGYRVLLPFFLGESRSRDSMVRERKRRGLVDKRPRTFVYTRTSRHENPFFAAYYLIRFGEDDWKNFLRVKFDTKIKMTAKLVKFEYFSLMQVDFHYRFE